MNRNKYENVNADDSTRELARKSWAYLKNHKIKSPTYKHMYSPDGGRTQYPYNTKEQLERLEAKYGK